MSEKPYKNKETFFIDPVEGLNTGVLKTLDLVVTQLPVEIGSYPTEKFVVTAGKKYGNLWSDNPWSDILDDEPLGNIYDLQLFLDKYYFLDIGIIYNRGNTKYNSSGEVEKDVHGNTLFTDKLVRIYEASRHVDNAPTNFMFKVFEDNGTTPITNATATVRLGNKETVIDYDEDNALYTGEVYGIGNGTLTIEADGFEDYIMPVVLSPHSVIQVAKMRQEAGYLDNYLTIVMDASA